MKLTELLTENAHFLTDPKQVREWLIKNSNYTCDEDVFTIHPNGVVDVGIYNLKIEGLVERKSHIVDKPLRKIPIKFGKIMRNLDCSQQLLTDTSFFPTSVEKLICVANKFTKLDNLPSNGQSLVAFDNLLTEFPNIPDDYGSINLCGNPITSLCGIASKIKRMKRYWDYCQIILTFTKIKEGGVGLILIDGLEKIFDELNSMPEPFRIIRKYLGQPDKIFDCQAELIENGFEEFAKL